MNPSSRQILEVIQAASTRAEAELLVRIHGLDHRVYSDGTYVALSSDAAWQAILREDAVAYFTSLGVQSCEYDLIGALLKMTP